MATPNQGGGLNKTAGTQVLPGADLGLPQIFASSVAASGVPFQMNAGIVMLLGQTASGTNVAKIATAATSGAIAAAFSSVSGAATATFSSSTIQVCYAFTTVANTWVGIQLSDGGSGSTFADKTLACFTVFVLEAKENWNTVVSGFLATASTIRGDGLGYVSTAQLKYQ